MLKQITLTLLSMSLLLQAEEPFILGSTCGELGNNLFQVATASALAWDNGATTYFPELIHRSWYTIHAENLPHNYTHVLYRCDLRDPPTSPSFEWQEPSLAYHPIPYQPNMRTRGYFQSEKYFAHYRDRIIELFSPTEQDLEYIQSKYEWLISHPCSVGVQVRKIWEDPTAKIYPQHGKNYLRKAMAFFPDNALFIVTTNDLEFAKKTIPSEMKNIIFLENEPNYIDLFLMSFCKHNIIGNSSFGWWGAWLNQNPNKLVIAPKTWYTPSINYPTQDLIPESWIRLDATWGPLEIPSSYGNE